MKLIPPNHHIRSQCYYSDDGANHA